MGSVLRLLLNWSEVWATVIPIAAFMASRNQPKFMRPVIIYFFIAMFLNLIGNIIGDFKRYLPEWMQSNNPMYNIHSVARFICFSLFFIGLKQSKLTPIYKSLPWISLVILIANFTLIDDFFNPNHLSGNLLAGEAYLLLIYCMLYYLYRLREDDLIITREPDFWVVTGLALYVVANFFVFLFYVPMINADSQLANRIWDVHNCAYITLCLLNAKAIYDAPRYQPAV